MLKAQVLPSCFQDLALSCPGEQKQLYDAGLYAVHVLQGMLEAQGFLLCQIALASAVYPEVSKALTGRLPGQDDTVYLGITAERA